MNGENGAGWVQNLFRPLVVGAMMACVALSLVDLVRVFFPHWSSTYMVIASFLAALEANYSYRIIRRRGLRGGDVLRFRAVEVAMLFLLVRAASLVGRGWAEVWAEMRQWPVEPWRFLELEIAYAYMLALLSWMVGTATTYDLERIGEPPVRDKYYVYPVDALVSRFLWGGALILVTAGIARLGISALLDLTRPSAPGLVLNVLIYFILGLAMLAQIQYARLSHRWREEGIEVPRRLSAHWVRYTLLFLALTGLVAFLLPTGYTLPLLDAIGVVLSMLLYVFNLVFQLALLLLMLLMLPLAMLLGIPLGLDPSPDPGPPPEFPTPEPGAPAPGWFEVVRSIAFWVVATGVIVYVVRSYLRDRPELVEAVTSLKVFAALRRFIGGIWRRLTRAADTARARLARQARVRQPASKEGESPEPGLFGFLRRRGRSARERALFYYLSILRRAGEQGYPRGGSQTPYEYDAELGPEVPQAEEELDRLTETFVEARYSTHPIERDQERRGRAAWKRVLTALRSLRWKQEEEREG